MNVKGYGKKAAMAKSGYYPAICLEGLRNIAKTKSIAVSEQRFKPSISRIRYISELGLQLYCIRIVLN
jgi:hypothetical protein